MNANVSVDLTGTVNFNYGITDGSPFVNIQSQLTGSVSGDYKMTTLWVIPIGSGEFSHSYDDTIDWRYPPGG